MKWNADNFKTAIEQSGIEKVKFWPGWKNTWHGMDRWAGNEGRPVALILHHTAGASTSSTDPNHAGNKCSADDGQAKFVNRHPSFNSPASQFTIRRCGQLDVNTMNPCYHAGEGSFNGTPWKSLGISTNSANRYLMGVEIVSKGLKDDLTDAQWETLARLYHALAQLADWGDDISLRTPRHKDWTPRKVDIKASRKRIEEQIVKYTRHWDGQVPDIEGIYNAEKDPSLKNPAAWRLACRLADLGFFKGAPVKGEQGYPTKAVAAWQASKGYDVQPPGKYGPVAHDKIFGS